MSNKINKHYVSGIDKQLNEFNRTHPKTKSQQAEIDKYQRLNESRDNPTPAADPSKGGIWEEF